MNSKEQIRAIIVSNAADRCGFWLGNPHAPRLIISPGHETVLSNMPPENIAAMANAALERLK